MANRFLSGRELFQHMRPAEATLPERGGEKEHRPDGSWLEGKKLEVFLKDRHIALSEERVKKVAALAVGEWLQDEREVKLVKEAGKFLQYMGHNQDGKNMLYPEEALFLIEQGHLEVSHGGLPLSVQQAYALLLGRGMPPEHYQVYSHLARMGFIITRFNGPSTLTNFERQIGLHLASKQLRQQNRKRRGRQNNSKQSDVPNTEIKKAKQEIPKVEDSSIESNICRVDDEVATSEHQSDEIDLCMNISATPETEDHDTISSCIAPESDTVTFGRYTMPLIKKQNDTSIVRGSDHTTCFANISIPDISRGCSTVDLTSLSPSLLPPGIEPEKLSYGLKNKCTSGEVSGIPNNRQHGSHWIQADNWAQYKQRLSEMTEQEVLEASPVGHLWSQPVKPLVKPTDARNMETILKKLAIFKEDIPEKSLDGPLCDIPIVFNVHLPDKNYRKTEERVPNHRVCITSQDKTCCDGLANLAHKWRVCSDGVPIHWAIVDNGELVFYSFTAINLPTDTS